MQGLLSFITCIKKDESMFWTGFTSELLKSSQILFYMLGVKALAVNMIHSKILVIMYVKVCVDMYVFLWLFSDVYLKPLFCSLSCHYNKCPH